MAQLTNKLWKTLSTQTRKDIINTIYGNSYPEVYSWHITNNYSHDFDYDKYGPALKRILGFCRVQSDGTIDVVLTINPTYAPKPIKTEVKRQTKPATPVQNTRQTWYIDYDDKDGDLCHIWCEAESREEAINYLHREYWNVGEVIRCYPVKD